MGCVSIGLIGCSIFTSSNVAENELGGGKRHKSVRHSEGEGVRASHTMLRPWLWTELLTAVVGSNTAQETAQIGIIILSIIRKYRRKT